MVKVFVAGATGKQGGATARALLNDGHVVHSFVRNAESDQAKALKNQGAEIFQGDWDDEQALKAAVTGTAAVFFPSFPSITDPKAEVRWATKILEAARQAASVQHVVYSTVWGTDIYDLVPGWDRIELAVNYWRSKSAGEDLVRNGGFKFYTILRPTEFMTNYLNPSANFQLGSLLKDGAWRTPFPQGFLKGLIDPDDIGRIAATVISTPEKFDRKELEVTADILPVKGLLKLLSEASGKELKVQTYEREEALKLTEANPIVQVQLQRVIQFEQAGIKNNPGDFGLELKSFKQFLLEHRAIAVDTYKNVP